MMQNSGPIGSAMRASSHGSSFVPSPIVHPDLATSPSLAATNEQRAAAAIQVPLAQRERFVDAQAGAPQHHDQSAKPPTVHTVAARPVCANAHE
jgi:hypothetical protein